MSQWDERQHSLVDRLPTLDKLKLIEEGELTLVIGDVTKKISKLSLQDVTSYSDIASLIQAKLNAEK